MMVIGLHFTTLLAPGVPLIGAAGVDIFFVVSGFVIALSADRLMKTPAPSRTVLFAILRLGRVWPFWIFALCLFALTLNGSVGLKDLTLYPRMEGRLVADPLLFVGWTLRFEVFFYALMAVALLTARPTHFMILALPILAIVGMFVDRAATGWLAVGTSPLLLEFWFGILLYLAWQRRWLGVGGLSSVIAALALCFATMLFRDFGYMPVAVPREFVLFGGSGPLPRWLVWGVPSAAIVALLLRASPVFASTAARPVLWTGAASYMLYLGHPFGMQLLDRMFPNDLSVLHATAVMMCAAVLVSIPAFVLHRLVERPVISGVRWLARTGLKKR